MKAPAKKKKKKPAFPAGSAEALLMRIKKLVHGADEDAEFNGLYPLYSCRDIEEWIAKWEAQQKRSLR